MTLVVGLALFGVSIAKNNNQLKEVRAVQVQPNKVVGQPVGQKVEQKIEQKVEQKIDQPQEKQTEKTIFSFKREVGLTDDQEAKLKALVYDMQQILGANKIKLDALMADLSRMIKNKDNMELIKKKLEEIAKIQVESTYFDIANSRKIQETLSAEQIKKWDAIKEHEMRLKK